MEENLKRVEEIKIVRSLKMDLNNPRYRHLNKKEKTLILAALNDYEHSLINLVAEYNNNAKIFISEGIEAKEVEIPKQEEIVPNYEFADSLILDSNKSKSVLLKDTTRMILSGDPIHHDLTEKEFLVLAKALKDYAFNLQVRIEQENNKKLDEKNQETETFKPISQEEILNILYSSIKEEPKKH